MDIPAHRAAAVVPTPAHSFERRDGDRLVNLTEEEAATATASAPPVTKGRKPASEPAPAAPLAD
ncbi:hypothetical protein ACIU1J_19610 [Azospirillum doebereinerae]|uniref:hypothetical protein n=1 Tax=Azospirillum doebereinerae TaxID=92933 RepID=UPI001EE5B37E|nr:hypothetical protein [Azospirillum doebereinerae]MCG5241870.1 hypothetical protein [Azospirillum doebereinerae]